MLEMLLTLIQLCPAPALDTWDSFRHDIVAKPPLEFNLKIMDISFRQSYSMIKQVAYSHMIGSCM